MQPLTPFMQTFPSDVSATGSNLHRRKKFPLIEHQQALEKHFLRQELFALEQGIQPIQDFFHNALGLAGVLGISSFTSQTIIKLLITHGLFRKPLYKRELLTDLILDLLIGALLGGGIGAIWETLRLKEAARIARQQFEQLTTKKATITIA